MKRLQPRKYRFSWRSGNHFELLVDGPSFFPPMLDAIGAARREILLEMYFVSSGQVVDRFVTALTAAAGRGVRVRLLLDNFGAMGLGRGDRDLLERTGVEVLYYNPLRLVKLTDNLSRDHRKLLLVDDEIAFVGGAGLTDEFDPPTKPEACWRETMISIRGPVLSDWRAAFDTLWQRVSRLQRLPRPATTASADPEATGPETAGIMAGRVTLIRGPAVQEIKRSLLRQIGQARNRLWIATPYFIPSWRIRRALRRAARRGIDVRLLLSGPVTDHPAVRHSGHRFYARLLANGVRIFEYQPRVLHQKAVLCDQWASIGSCNFDRWNLRWNLEANQEIDDAGFAASLAMMFEDDFGQSLEINAEEWQNRSLLSRLVEYGWGRVDLWLSRLGRGRP